MRSVPPGTVLAELDIPAEPFVAELVDGVAGDLAEIDPILRSSARDWSLERMSALDRGVLRIGTWELRHRDDTPTAVILNEAVELAKRYGATDEAGSFANGVLARVARTVRPASPPAPSADPGGAPSESAGGPEGQAEMSDEGEVESG